MGVEILGFWCGWGLPSCGRPPIVVGVPRVGPCLPGSSELCFCLCWIEVRDVWNEDTRLPPPPHPNPPPTAMEESTYMQGITVSHMIGLEVLT